MSLQFLFRLPAPAVPPTFTTHQVPPLLSSFGLAFFFGLTFLSCCGRLIKINEVRWLFILLMEVSAITWIDPPSRTPHPGTLTLYFFTFTRFRCCWPWGVVNIYNFWLHFNSVNCAENQAVLTYSNEDGSTPNAFSYMCWPTNADTIVVAKI